MGPVIDLKMHNLQEIISFLAKIRLYLNLHALIIQYTQKCVDNCSDDLLLYICLSNYYQFFANRVYNSENSVFLVKYQTNSLLGHVHEA